MQYRIALVAALGLAVSLGACAEFNNDKPPAHFASAEQGPPANFSLPSFTDGYEVVLYPGVGKNFNPNPTLTAEENTELGQLDYYCDTRVNKMSGRLWDLTKVSAKYGVLEGLGGMLGALIGFGSHINPAAYFAYTGFTALLGGTANADEKWQEMMLESKGYCMTLMVYKADELESKLERVTVVPTFVGSGTSPVVDAKGSDPFAIDLSKPRQSPPPPPGM